MTKTTELINKALGEKEITPGLKDKFGKFITGKDIQEECEKYEQFIAKEGAATFVERVKNHFNRDGNISGGTPDKSNTALPTPDTE